MSYISILLPGIQCPSKNITQAKSYFSEIMNIDQSEFTINELENSKKPEFYIKFKNSNLNLLSFQQLLEERESLNEKISLLENELKVKSENTSKTLIDDNESKSIILSNRIKNLLSIHLENSESFKVSTERTLEKIKEEFEFLVSEFEEIKKIDSNRHSKTNRKEKEKNNSLTSRSKNATTNINIIFNSFKHNNEDNVTKTNLSNKTSQGPVVPKLNLDQYKN